MDREQGETGWVRVGNVVPSNSGNNRDGPNGFSSSSMIPVLNPRCYNIRMSVKGFPGRPVAKTPLS